MNADNRLPAIVGLASNLRGGTNPPYGVSDFTEMYPQFISSNESDSETSEDTGNTESVPLIPLVMLENYIALAHASIKQSRYREAWKICMGLFIAHFTTLYLETMVDSDGDSSTVAKAGQAGGLMSSKSVDGVSVSYDFSQVTSDLEGWADWKATSFGTQLATFAKMFSMGGMYVR